MTDLSKKYKKSLKDIDNKKTLADKIQLFKHIVKYELMPVSDKFKGVTIIKKFVYPKFLFSFIHTSEYDDVTLAASIKAVDAQLNQIISATKKNNTGTFPGWFVIFQREKYNYDSSAIGAVFKTASQLKELENTIGLKSFTCLTDTQQSKIGPQFASFLKSFGLNITAGTIDETVEDAIKYFQEFNKVSY